MMLTRESCAMSSKGTLKAAAAARGQNACSGAEFMLLVRPLTPKPVPPAGVSIRHNQSRG